MKQARSKDFEDGFSDPWDLIGDPSSLGLGDPSVDPWDVMGDPTQYGLSDPNVDPTFSGTAPTGSGESGSFSLPSLPSWLRQLLGLGGNGSTGGNGSGIGALLPLLGLVGGITSGVTGSNATREATDAMLRANQEATDLIRGQMQGASAPFKPYSDAGAGAIGRMQAMPQSDLASRYRPLGSGRGMTLGQLAKGR